MSTGADDVRSNLAVPQSCGPGVGEGAEGRLRCAVCAMQGKSLGSDARGGENDAVAVALRSPTPQLFATASSFHRRSFAVLVGFLWQVYLQPFCVGLATLDRIHSPLIHGRKANGLS